MGFDEISRHRVKGKDRMRPCPPGNVEPIQTALHFFRMID